MCLVNILAMVHLLLVSRKKYKEIITLDPNIKEEQSYCIFTLIMVRSVQIDLFLGIVNVIEFFIIMCFGDKYLSKYVDWISNGGYWFYIFTKCCSIIGNVVSRFILLI